MKITEIRERNTEELNDQLENMKKKLFDFRTESATQKLEDPTQITKTRRDIARIKTVLREREIAESKK